MQFIDGLSQLDKFDTEPFQMEKWTRYADSVYPGLATKCKDDSEAYTFATDILPIVVQAIKESMRLQKTVKLFKEIEEELRNNVHILFDYEPDVLIILYLGLCNGAGWATRIGEQRVVLLGAEKIIELNWDNKEKMQGLIYHELGHIWHEYEGVSGFAYQSTSELAIQQLYREGIAMACEQILCSNMTYYHQGEEWSVWCEENIGKIKKEYFRRIENQESVREFYGDWNYYEGFSDVGYYLGAQFIRYLMKYYSLKEIATLSYKELYQRFEAYVSEERA